jgi:hypothetical protein
MSKPLWMRLVLPLILFFGAAIFMNFVWEAQGFFLNLATELVGILITISYVDWILRHHEKLKWLPTDTRIANRLRILLNATISSIRSGLGFSDEVIDARVTATLNLVAIHKDIIRVAEQIIAPEALTRIQALNQDAWKSLARQIQNAHNGVLTFINVFQSRLSPDQICNLLDLQESLSNSLTYYTVFPDLMGVPEDKLPQTKTPPEMLQKFGCESTAKEIQKICELAKKLSESVDDTGV